MFHVAQVPLREISIRTKTFAQLEASSAAQHYLATIPEIDSEVRNATPLLRLVTAHERAMELCVTTSFLCS